MLAAACGGQIVLSESTERLVRDELPPDFRLVDLGAHKLRDVARPQHIYELQYPGALEFSRSLRSARASSVLPEEISTFIGRTAEVSKLRKLLGAKRLITIVGTGGVGKTRLAWRVAHLLRENFGSGIWAVDAATIADEDALLQALCKTMRIGAPGSEALAQILYAIDERPALFLFDNAERSIATCAWFARNVLAYAPHAKIMVTSREPLRVAGEHAFMLEPFSAPDPLAPLEHIRKNDAVRLFLERAKTSGASLALDARNAEAIVAICRRLDGIPLAIELAAARALTLAPAQIVQRLNQRFNLLTGGTEGVDHHRTLRVSIDWSYDLLAEGERNAFVQGAVFQGPFSCEAAERVFGKTSDSVELLDALGELVSKSFLRTVDEDGAKRYAYLETLHAYALERLTESGTLAALAEAHFGYHRDLIDSERSPESPTEPKWLDGLERSYRDVVAALEWALQKDPAEGARLALKLVSFCHTRGYLTEGAAILERAAEMLDAIEQSQRGRLLVAAAGMRNAVGDNDCARKDAEAAREIFASVGDEEGGLNALRALASVYTNAGDYSAAHAAFLKVLDGFARFPNEYGEAQTLANLGIVLTAQAQWEEANAYLLQALETARDLTNQRIHAWVIGSLGNLAQQSGKYAEARDWYERGLDLCRSIGEKSAIATLSVHLAQLAMATADFGDAPLLVGEALEIAFEHGLMLQLVDALDAAAQWSGTCGDAATAARLFAASDAMRERLNFPLKGPEQTSRERVIDSIRSSDTAVFDQAARAGRNLDVEEAVRLARASLRVRH
ncbi:MAG: tetratricopeptide repeat protein [Candidatus Eremiobacteraeota bacterium]|nr:tetratricopeptide repeat protein [Candidatus Eremiobacteraeota bacterium]